MATTKSDVEPARAVRTGDELRMRIKAILGFTNRSVEQAQLPCSGSHMVARNADQRDQRLMLVSPQSRGIYPAQETE